MIHAKEHPKSEHVFKGVWITDKTIPYDKKKSPVPLSVRRTFSLIKKLRRAVSKDIYGWERKTQERIPDCLCAAPALQDDRRDGNPGYGS